MRKGKVNQAMHARKGKVNQAMHLDAIISWILQKYSKKLQCHDLMHNYLINQVCYELGCCKQLGLQPTRAVVSILCRNSKLKCTQYKYQQDHMSQLYNNLQ
jgi:hypothetical protein